MSTATFHPPLIQIAFSVIDLRRAEAWFRDGLGFLPAGGGRLMMTGALATRVQGLPKAASCAWWMVGRNPFFQFEMFQFTSPPAQLMPADFRPCDTGFTRIGVHVHDFDAALANLARLGTQPLAPVLGERGSRRACVRSPDGVYVEVMEDDPLPQPPGSERSGCPVAVRSVTMSTPDLDGSVAYLTAVNGKGPEKVALHTPEHEALWGLPGAHCKRAIFRSGDVLVEVVQYVDPVGKPWPDGYRICDQGILNIAYGAHDKRGHMEAYERAVAFGAKPNCRPFHLPTGGVVYLNDRLNFSVEITWIKPGRPMRDFGFEPRPRDARPLPDNRTIEASVRIAAPVGKVWDALVDQDRWAAWCGFDTVTVTREGQSSRHGIGSERRMSSKLGTFVEQIVGVEPQRGIRYRVIDGAPFNYHRGEITLAERGAETEVHWRIGFRGKVPLVGALIRAKLQPMLRGMLEQGLKLYVERGTAGR